MRTAVLEFLAGPLRRLKALLLGMVVALTGAAAVVLVLARATSRPPLFAPLGVVLAIAGLWLLLLTIALIIRLSAKVNDTRALLTLTFNLRERNEAVGTLFADGAAADASLLLFVFKVLHIAQPRSILELGSGQSTKLLATYARDNDKVRVVTLEHDVEWHRHFGREIGQRPPNWRYDAVPLREVTLASPVTRGASVRWYDVPHDVLQERYELLIVDGPVGTAKMSRAGILNFLPSLLAQRFILVFDDAERPGEIDTLNACRYILKGAGLAFSEWELNGLKRQYIFASPTMDFMRYC